MVCCGGDMALQIGRILQHFVLSIAHGFNRGFCDLRLSFNGFNHLFLGLGIWEYNTEMAYYGNNIVLQTFCLLRRRVKTLRYGAEVGL